MKRLLALVPILTTTVLATGDFYEEALPPLSVYLKLDRLPKKSVLDISRETKPVAAADLPDIRKELPKIISALRAGKASKEFVKQLDAWIAAERLRLPRPGSGLNALLHDIRDLCAGEADAAAAASYLEWRAAVTDKLGYAIATGREELPDWFMEAKPPEDGFVKDVQKRIAEASAPVKAHYAYSYAAYNFRLLNENETLFDEVVAKYPDHPRAEPALYMLGRCLSRQSRVADGDGYRNVPEKAAAARKAFEAYIQKYPEGRYVGDAYGWLGGLEMNAGNFAKALPYFVKQLDVPGHPEFAESATKEIETCFRRLHDNPAALAESLTDARVAQAAVYFAANEIEPVDGNGEYESAEFVEAWRKSLFPALASVLAKKKELFDGPGWQPRYVAALALAASGAGQQDEALKILESAPADAVKSDDVALARAVVLQRARRSGEAANAFEALAQKFPRSPLVPAARVRQALALVDDHRCGEAVVALRAALHKREGARKPVPDLPQEEPAAEEEFVPDEPSRAMKDVEPADQGQIRQLLDTLYNFAPLQELAATANSAAAPEEVRNEIRQIIAVRHLARERFDEAKPFFTPAEWERAVAPLADLTAAAQAAKTPADKAATAAKLAEAWAAARGKLLTVPLDAEKWRHDVYRDEHPVANFTRLTNAPALGLTGATVLDLENRDELRHAFNWWLTASDADPKSPQAATAIWRALRSMPEIASVSPFTMDRAVVKKWEDVSHKLHDRLLKEHPNSPEAKRLAVWWTFPPGKTEDGAVVARGPYTGLLEKGDPGGEETPDDVVKGMVMSVLNARGKGEELKKHVASGRAWARKTLKALPSQCVVNFFEDLSLFLKAPGVPADAVSRYVELRYDTLVSGAIGYGIFDPRTVEAEKPGTVRGDDALLADIRAAMKEPRFAGVQDFLAFLELAVTANHWVAISMKSPSRQVDKNGDEPTYWGRDYVTMEKLCRDWLSKYQKSVKREAAMLLHCRALRHAMEPYLYYKRLAWPQAPRWEGGDIAEQVDRLKFDARTWKAALDLYDKEFPKGAYADDILGYRADLAIRLKDWKRAVQITMAQVQTDGYLQPSSGNRLRLIFSLLAKDEDRSDILAAIRSVDGARGALIAELANVESDPEHPLFYLHDWLSEQAQE